MHCSVMITVTLSQKPISSHKVLFLVSLVNETEDFADGCGGKFLLPDISITVRCPGGDREKSSVFSWLSNNSVSVRTQRVSAIGTVVNTTGQISIRNETGLKIMT